MQLLILCLLIAIAVARAADLDILLNERDFILAAGDPTAEPTADPTVKPTKAPTARPTTAPPSAKPTPMPTATPTALNLVKFTASHDMYDLDESDYFANQDAFDLTIQQSVAATMDLTADSVQDVSVTFPSSGSDRRKLQTITAHASYTIVAHKDGATYESLSTLLKEASVVGGVLNDYIATFAAANSISSFTVDPPVTEDLLYQRGTSTKLTGTQITGLIIGIFLFLALVGVIVGFALSNVKLPASQRAHESVDTQV